MIEFKPITEENFYDIIKIKGPEGTEVWTPPPVVTLAQAWLYKDSKTMDLHPFVICEEGNTVGFMALGTAPDCRNLSLWRIFFPEEHANKGYGGQAIRLLIRLARESQRFDAIGLCCHSENLRAKHVYEREGFRPTGEVVRDEIAMELKL